MPPRPRKAGRRRFNAVRKWKRGRRSVYGAKISSKTHVFKRFAQPIMIGNNNDYPYLIDNGAGQASLASIGGDDFGTEQFGVGIKSMLQSVIDYTDFTHLFDRYKIIGVKYKFMFQNNVSTVNGRSQPNAPLPLITYAFDGDDAGVPASRGVVSQKSYAKQRILNGNNMFSLYVKPRVDKAVYRSGTTSAYSSERAPWLDSTYTDVEHYGLKLWINNWLSDSGQSTMKLTIQPVFYLACKDVQ